ncbi:Sec1-like protein [Thalictrum thalictroides]|uniref:Sec1-like protein n=1 Tax=Thalictrum thalictroides TaxID=46969 RepID=A0A7J6X2Z5_THATH|nr:Sec1-like protein [Thalictrum thalictroides]
MDLVQVDSLGDRIFLLGASSCTSLSSSELGVKGNCVYLCTNMCTSLSRFDMEDGTITTTLPCLKKINNWDEPFWMVPDCKPQVKKEVTMVEEDKYDLNANLPPEIVTLILSRPFLGDCTRFRLACKSRIAITPPIRSHTSLVQYQSGSQHLPWFLSIPKNNKGLCNYYHPIYSDAFSMSIPHELAGAIVCYAKYDWLLMSKGRNSIVFFIPFTMETIQLSETGDPYMFVNIAFSAPPTSSDCVVFGHYDSGADYVSVFVYQKCENAWCFYNPPAPCRFLPSHCSPIFCDGLFYSLSKDGKLGAFNPNETEEENMWRLFPEAVVHQFSSWPWVKCVIKIRSITCKRNCSQNLSSSREENQIHSACTDHANDESDDGVEMECDEIVGSASEDEFGNIQKPAFLVEDLKGILTSILDFHKMG